MPATDPKPITLSLTLDMSDPMSVCSYVADAVEHWTDERRDALGRDLSAMLERGDGVDMLTCGPVGGLTAVVSAAFLDVLRRHGLDGA